MNPEREDAVEQDERERRLIEIIFGPCSRKEAEDVVLHVQETLDDTYPELGGATALHFGLDAASQSMAVPVSSADEREWTLMPGRGYTPTRTTVETETHIPVVPKSTLLAAQRRAEETENALKAMLARAGTERDSAKRLAERLEARWAAYGAGGVRREGELERAWEQAESERDALAGALREITETYTLGQAPGVGSNRLRYLAAAALAANPQASDG